MDDLLVEFLTETSESIEVVDIELVKLEKDPNNAEVLNNIFRLVHTIKGTCGFLGLPRLEEVAHAAENVLGKYRDGEISVTTDSVTLILAALDQIKEILGVIEATQEEPEGNDAELIHRLNVAASGGSAAEPVAAVADEPVAEEPVVEEAVADEIEIDDGRVSLDELEAAFNAAPGPEEMAAPSGSDEEIEIDDGRVSLEELEAAFNAAPGPEDTANAEEAGEATSADASLYERIGGAGAIEAAVELLYNKIGNDETLKEYFAGVNLEGQHTKMVGFLTAAMGGSEEYNGRDLTLSHAHLVKRGLNDGHFDAVAGHLSVTLKDLGVAKPLINEVLELVESTRSAILAGANEEASDAENTAGQSKAADQTSEKSESKAPIVAKQTLRVNVDLLENLMTMVSELVLTRNQLLQTVRETQNTDLAVPLQRLSQCTTELQEGVMKTRMQPVGNAWSKLPRIVRDLSNELGKKIDLQMSGEDTELDRQVLELIKDPLTHMVRNSADHGVETIEQRKAAGKPEVGIIALSAYHEGGHIIISIADDGKGLAVEGIRKKVIENGLATESELDEMSDQQIQQFIMKPGFSTAEKVTNVSGRGVGMDVVRSNIEKIGGTIEFTSTEGSGTSFKIKIPLTLAIVSALILECSGERFAIPQISVIELVRASPTSEHKVELINNTPVLRLRDRLLPLVYLDRQMGLRDDEFDPAKDEEAFVVVAAVGPVKFGIVVDRVFDTEEIVVKPVAPILREISLFSGNTILGDGSVIMILDPNGIASVAVGETIEDVSVGEEEDIAGSKKERVSMLVFRPHADHVAAVPLSLVARLEEIDVEEVEHSDGRMLIQYRGSLMPLITMGKGSKLKESGRQSVLVFSDEQRTMGLIVEEIIDIVDERLDVELVSDTGGVLGSAVISGKATEVIDVDHYVRKAYPDWFGLNGGKAGDNAFGGSSATKRVLLVDDSPFFRNMLKPLLVTAGYQVTTAERADEALHMRESGSNFDIILSDIEMPDMDGFKFASEIRSDERWQDTPLVALSAHSSAKDKQKGTDAGFDDYVSKSDREGLLNSLDQVIATTGVSA